MAKKTDKSLQVEKGKIV